MFRDKFKQELDPVKADQNLLSRTRRKIASAKEQSPGRARDFFAFSYASRRRRLRLSAALLCSLLVLTGLGIFFGTGGGANLSSHLFGTGSSKMMVNSSYALQEGSSNTQAQETAASTQAGSVSSLQNNFHDDSIYNYADYASIASILKRSCEDAANSGNFNTGKDATERPEGTIAATMTNPVQPGALNGQDNNGSITHDHSNTNTQVAGVDEADIIKNDGEYIYYISNTDLYVIDVRDPKNIKMAARIQNDFTLTNYYSYYLDLFFDSSSKTLTVISNSLYDSGNTLYKQEIYDLPASNNTDTAMSGSGTMPYDGSTMPYDGRTYPSQGRTNVTSYNMSDPSNPVEIRTFSQDGFYISSRRINDTVYLITSVNLWYDSKIPMEDLVPSTSDGKDNWITIPAPDIYFVNPDYAASYTVVSALNTKDSVKKAQTQAVVGQGSIVYASADTLYIAASTWDTPIYPTFDNLKPAAPSAQSSKDAVANADIVTTSPAVTDVYKTKILAFSITGGTLSAKASGSINGTLLNQYSLDEYNGCLRAATTSGGWASDSSNNVFVLDKSLHVISSLTGLAPGETIYSVRFAEGRIYLVTFEQVDPFFVIDASDPANLKVLGTLKIPGFSNYLHMLGNNMVLGIGSSTKATEGGVSAAGLKIAVFDVTDPSNPILKSSLVYGTTYGYSDVQSNPKALLMNLSRGLIGLPVSFDMPAGQFGSDYAAGFLLLHFDASGNLTHQNLFKDIDSFLSSGLCRGVYIDNTLFLVGSSEILAYSLDTYLPLGSLTIPTDNAIVY